MPATISVTGATGFIGRHVLARLLARPDARVLALAHAAPETALPRSERLRWVRGDLADASSLEPLLEPGCDLVSLAYPRDWPRERHVSAARALARLAGASGVRRIVHCSTAVVAGRTPARRVTEATAPEPATEYERIKLAVEEAWLESRGVRTELGILRPTAVFGPHGRNLIKLADALRSGNRIANYARSSVFGRRRMNLVPIATVVAAIEHLLECPAAQNGEIYIVSDDANPANNFRDVERALMQAWGLRDYFVPPLPVPQEILRTLLRLAGRASADPDRVYDSSKLARAGLRVEPLGLERGVREFASWYDRARREPPGDAL